MKRFSDVDCVRNRFEVKKCTLCLSGTVFILWKYKWNLQKANGSNRVPNRITGLKLACFSSPICCSKILMISTSCDTKLNDTSPRYLRRMYLFHENVKEIRNGTSESIAKPYQEKVSCNRFISVKKITTFWNTPHHQRSELKPFSLHYADCNGQLVYHWVF